MEYIRLSQLSDDEYEDEDKKICKQENQLEDMHHSILTLKTMTQNINSEIDNHITVMDNLQTSMTHNQDRVKNLTHQTKRFIEKSSDGIGGHTCLFAIAIILFFLIVILILFF